MLLISSAVSSLLAQLLPQLLPLALLVAPGPDLSGRVTDPEGAPIAQVNVRVVEAQRTVVTDAEGRWRVTGLATGTYRVSFAFIGYAPEVRRVTLGAQGATLDVVLRRSVVELPPVQVSASAVATTALESPQPVSVLAGGELRTAQASSVGETLEGVAGVRSWSTGPGVGKPVIRGLSSNRVLVVADGQRMEYQQWGDEHSPNVETVDAASIEVVRGPASVLYGSDALGGVVNVVRRPLPDAIGARPFVAGKLSAAYATNNRAPDGTLMLEGARGGLGWRGSVTGRTSEDLRTPGRVQFNTGNRALNGNGAVGWRGAWGTATLSASRRDERVEIHEDPAVNPVFTGYQLLRDDRVRADVQLPVRAARLEAGIGWERNRRSEFNDAAVPEVATGLLSRALTADVRFHHAPLGPVAGTLGLSAMRVAFDGYGSSALVPDNRWHSIGAYAFEQATLGRWDLSAGGRVDHRVLAVDDEPALGVTARSQSWQAATGNVGVLYRVAEPLALVVNAGRGFRTPSGPELFANGVHAGVLAYEIGNPDLAVETSLNLDAAVRAQTSRVRAEVSVFRNAIDNYIYLRPTGERHAPSGLPVYRFEQGDAVLTGLEASAEVRPWTALQLRASADHVRGQNTATDTPLPWIPPFRLTWGARLQGDVGRALRDGYVGVNGETHARQRHLDPKDFAPPGYTLLHFEAGFVVPVAGEDVTVDLSLRNALDARYTRFMNRYKSYALEMGRNLLLKVGMPFTL